MKAEIYSNEKIIGTSDLKLTDKSMNVVSGKFTTTIHYEEVKKIVWGFHDLKSKTNHDDLEKLRLNAKLENGYFIFPLGGFLINDFEEHPNEEKTFEAIGIFRHVIEDNFLGNSPKDRILEPWELISIEQKIAFEDELRKEIGVKPGKRIFNFLYPKKHKLTEFDFCAIATSCRNDDVLFAIKQKGENQFDYAVIHLTWKGKLEKNDSFPIVEFFEDFDQFINCRMYPDKKDWEN